MARYDSISTILDDIERGACALPVFQRGYVWNGTKVRKLFASLYRGYPIGSLLAWEPVHEVKTRSNNTDKKPPRYLLIDGQQRMMSLFGVMRGKEPPYFDGKPGIFSGLYFNLEQESFEFYQGSKMKDDSLWIDVSELYTGNSTIGSIVDELQSETSDITKYVNRLSRLQRIKELELHIDEVKGEDKTEEIVSEIFQIVNQSGTNLSGGDIALAKICVDWDKARTTMQTKIDNWEKSGYKFKRDWLLRVMCATITGRAKFDNLKSEDTDEIKTGLKRAESHIDKILNRIDDSLGLSDDKVLFGKYTFPTIAAFLEFHGNNPTPKQWNRLIYWYVHASMWGRYSGSTESTLEKDLAIVRDSKTPDNVITSLIDALRDSRGSLDVEPNNFNKTAAGATFYPVLQLLTHLKGSKDLITGLPLRRGQLGNQAQLQKHHLFPQALMKEHGYEQNDWNSLANYCFLTAESNKKIGKRYPGDYFSDVANNHPGALESHWIPMDRRLWKIENYFEFLEERRNLLARATNDLLNGLLA